MRFLREIQLIAVLLFGIAVPIAVLLPAWKGVSTLAANVGDPTTNDQLVQTFANARANLHDGNDYVLMSLFYTEHANQKTMVNKQIMKVTTMQIGFAVISMGVMFIILGINDGGATTSAGLGDVKFDLKTGSTGVVVFVVGALMAAAGGLLKNDYSTVPIPSFSAGSSANERSLDAYVDCRRLPAEKDFEDCFAKSFAQINDKVIK